MHLLFVLDFMQSFHTGTFPKNAAALPQAHPPQPWHERMAKRNLYIYIYIVFVQIDIPYTRIWNANLSLQVELV